MPTVALLSLTHKLISFKVKKSNGLEAVWPQPWIIHHMQREMDLQKSKILLIKCKQSLIQFLQSNSNTKVPCYRAQKSLYLYKKERK